MAGRQEVRQAYKLKSIRVNDKRYGKGGDTQSRTGYGRARSSVRQQKEQKTGVLLVGDDGEAEGGRRQRLG